MRLGLSLALLLALLAPATSQGFVIREHGGLGSTTNGIVLGPDGNFWVSEYGTGKVARIRPDGSLIGHLTVGDNPTSLTSGPGGRVWVAVTGADKLVWIDAMSAMPATHDVPLAGPCGPVAMAAPGNGKLYFSQPADGVCGGTSLVGFINEDGSGSPTTFSDKGRVYDLEVSGGALFAPDFNGNVIRRFALDNTLTPQGAVTVASGGNPDGITIDSTGTVWTTLFTQGKVSRHPASQTTGEAQVLTPTGGTLTSNFGIVTGADGRIYVTGQDSANLARIDPATNAFTFYPTPGGKPWQIVNGPDGDLWFTDQASFRVLRFVNAPPRVETGAAEVLAPTAATLKGRVDSRGNDTTVVFEYGPTAAYGASTTPVNVAAGIGFTDVQSALSGLQPGTTYHARMRATNAEGTTTGPDTVFTTQPRPPVKLEANARFTWAFARGRLVLTKVRIQNLVGGETAVVTCKGKGCPFKKKTYRNLKRGTKNLSRIFGRKRRLRAGIRITVTVTKPPDIGRVAILTVRKGARDPRIVRRCLPAGATKPAAC